jgi:hypothetical protein
MRLWQPKETEVREECSMELDSQKVNEVQAEVYYRYYWASYSKRKHDTASRNGVIGIVQL